MLQNHFKGTQKVYGLVLNSAKVFVQAGEKDFIPGREAGGSDRPWTCWSLHHGQAEGVQVLPPDPGHSLASQVDQLSGENLPRHPGQISTHVAERPEGRISWRKRSNSGATD